MTRPELARTRDVLRVRNPHLDGGASLASGVSEQVRRSRKGRSREVGLGASSLLRSIHGDLADRPLAGVRAEGSSSPAQAWTRRPARIASSPVLPQGSSGGSERRCRGPAEPPPVSGRRGSPRPSSCARARSGVVPAGKSHPRAQPRLSGLARSSPHRLVRTPTVTVRTHDGPVPREGLGGGCLLAAASAAPWGRQRDDGREAPGREAQESSEHGAPATEGHRNGCSYGARP